MVDAHAQAGGEAAAARGFVGQHQGRFLAVLRVSGVDFADAALELLEGQ